jgi:hypothetical protein
VLSSPLFLAPFLSFLMAGTFLGCFGSFAAAAFVAASAAAATAGVIAVVFSAAAAAARAREEATRFLCGFLASLVSPPWLSAMTAIVLL